jgi:NAD(P)-dependent dehydrogenase (short-subunit alcohol dehydrogenase family)
LAHTEASIGGRFRRPWGNGKAAAVLFARAGAKIFAVDLHRAAEETREIIAAEGGDATCFTADVSKAQTMKSQVDACIKAYSRIDILLNNVGILAMGGRVEMTEEVWDHQLAVNASVTYWPMWSIIGCRDPAYPTFDVNLGQVCPFPSMTHQSVPRGESRPL